MSLAGRLGLRFAPAAAILAFGATVGATVALVSVKVLAPAFTAPADEPEEAASPRRARARRLHALRETDREGAAQVVAQGAPQEPPQPAAQEPPQPAAQEPARPAAPVILEAAPAEPERTVPAAPAAHEPGADRPRRSAAPLPTSARPGGSANPHLAEETAFMERALSALHDGTGPDAATAALRAYLARYPHGTFRQEAELALVDALVTAGRISEAHAALESLAARQGGLTADLRVLRAELMPSSRACEALDDLDNVIASVTRGPLLARALFARADRRGACGDATGARHDLEEYQRRFPAGPRAAEVARSLGRARP
jgi:hypothetical protein